MEEGADIRNDLTVIMVAPKSPGTEVQEEYKRGFGVPTLLAVHTENDPGAKVGTSPRPMLRERAETGQLFGIEFHCRSEVGSDGRADHSLWYAPSGLAAMLRPYG